jgi:hypothetical protein
MIERFTFDRLRTALLFVAIATAACLMPAQHDTWWLLRAGQDMWATRHVLLTDTYSHTVYGAAWPNHEWLSQALFYAIYAVGGLPLLTLAAAAVVTSAWTVVWAETRGSAKTKFLMTAFVLATATTTWSLRAQVLSLLLVVSTMALLRRRHYAWLPPLFWVWANLHGAVLLGVLLLVAALAAALVEDIKAVPRLAAASALCLVATALTPLGWHFWLDMPQSLGRIRQLGIDEWAAPSLTAPTLIPFWIAIAAVVVLAAARGRALLKDPIARRDGSITICACALALVPLAVTAVRNVPPFLMLALPAIAVLMPDFPAAAPASATRYRPRLNAALAAAAAAIAALAVGGAYRSRLAHFNWSPLPAASIAALDRCDGNVYNRYDEGGYLIWFAPGRRVFLDGRQDPYPSSLIREQMLAETSGDFEPLFARYDVRCAYVPAASAVSARLVRAGWTPLFRDPVWAVLARDEPRTLRGRDEMSADDLGQIVRR